MRVPVFIGSSIDVDELCKLMEQERGNIKSSSSGALKPQS
eukprot:CAMPEP_0196660556 /NCGR_PEP_ID=MMETSP1086-20130531/40298_1 /TAXON_ID=77921 /ORGANISM="Cyanoptyche  gloeocystis , Strain SAG4.97" /LENGTH=39 /DNA_ID= /DNA_START= /DNA_END= /DNA_ORIENTATION=